MIIKPIFRKPDRYKLSSYYAYNTKMPGYYDSAYFIRLFQLPLWHRTVVEELRSQLSTSDILDVGCGTGRLLAELAKAGATSLSGIDLAQGIMNDAQKKFTTLNVEVDLREADAEDNIPWDDSSFDIVTLTGALHHFYRPHDALLDMYRVLRPGGHILVIDPCFFTPFRQVFNLYLTILPHDGDYRIYTAKRAQKLIEHAGFKVIKTKRVGIWAYYINASKP
ncbi:class I SAM-dependent methyltransferase [Candidatus Latescibacterota bacterium]